MVYKDNLIKKKWNGRSWFLIFGIIFIFSFISINIIYLLKKEKMNDVTIDFKPKTNLNSLNITNNNTINDFSLFDSVLNHVKFGHDIVYIRRFYYEKKLSFARDKNYDNLLNTLSEPPFAPNISNFRLPSLSWSRNLRKDNILMRKNNYISTFTHLSKHMTEVIHNYTSYNINQSNNNHNQVQLKALRYQNYFDHCYMLSGSAGDIEELPLPVLLTTKLDINSGYLSSDIWPKTCLNTGTYDKIRNRCVDPIFLNKTLAKCHKTYDDYKTFLDSQKILLMLTSQHNAFYHPKVISLPLGMKPGTATNVVAVMHHIHNERRREKGKIDSNSNSNFKYDSNTVKNHKKKLLVINNSGWNYRQDVNAYFMKVFNETNTYRLGKYALPIELRPPGYHAEKEFLQELVMAKFIICPAGLGFDTFRMWQALALGVIPIVESSPGLDRLYSLLPVLVVDTFFTITPEYLESMYPCFVQHAHDWKYEILTQQYWDQLIVQALSTSTIDHVLKNHPPNNPYCNGLKSSQRLSPIKY